MSEPSSPGENSVPWFWPFSTAATLADEELTLLADNLKFLAEKEKIDHAAPPRFATHNQLRLELHTLRLRDFSPAGTGGVATVVDAPYAGHSSAIADYHKGQSLVETLLANGLQRVVVTDWKSATMEMKDYDIDNYLAELNVCVDDLGGRVNLVGLCQGGWMSAMFAARYPDKVASLVLAGAPIDTAAGHGPIKKLVKRLPVSVYQQMVELGGGLMKGEFMLAGWKNMHPDKQYFNKYIDLYEHIDDPRYLSKQETFARWYENPIDLPGRWYLQAIVQLFRENRFFHGKFVGLGRTLSLEAITCPVYLLAGEQDDITTSEQVFNAEQRLGTPAARIVKKLAPGGHIGLFMGSRTLNQFWPDIAKWIAHNSHAT